MKITTESPDNTYTQKVKRLIEQVYPNEWGHGSLFDDAKLYFYSGVKIAAEKQDVTQKLENFVENDDAVQSKVALEDKLKTLTKSVEESRHARLTSLRQVALRLLELCDGDSYQETQLLSAKFLGTVMLITRGKDRNFARLHQRLKPLYKAVLTLRLADKIIADNKLKHGYLAKFSDAHDRFQGDRDCMARWQNELAIPLIVAAIMQDIGLQHPDSLAVLYGEDGKKDEFRVLDETERKRLLKLNFNHTLDYIQNGLGLPKYIGNDKAERATFNDTQQHINDFITQVVRDAYVSKVGIGELVKIPQIYASIILSTKPDYTRKALPKGYLLIEQLAKKGALNAKMAEAFISIVGYFPQGFGVTYIPRNEKGVERDHYECAIVTQLNPKHPAEPVVRPVTRGLTYITSIADETVPRSTNLYFKANHKKLMRIGKDRLAEIMSGLSANFTQEDIEALVPTCWEPSDYFSIKKYQNLWNRY